MLSVKELLVVLVIASIVFAIAKPMTLTFTAEADFYRRRKAWFVLTAAAFLSPSFWILVVVAIPVLIVTARKDANPAAVYLMLLSVIPPVSRQIPMLFTLNTYLLLSFFVLVPIAVRTLRQREAIPSTSIRLMDLFLLSYGILSSFHYLQARSSTGDLYPITLTDSLRRVIVFMFITYVPYFVISRTNTTRRMLLDTIAAYCVASAVMAGTAIFESLHGWLLYNEVPGWLGDESGIPEYLIREHSLRAMASSGHPLTLATLLSICVPLWLYLRPRTQSPRSSLALTLVLIAGLLVTYSRGPWTGTAISCLVYLALRPKALSTLFKSTIVVMLLGAILSMTPIGEKLFSLLPIFGGKADIGSLTYRESLLDHASVIIYQHPWIGDTRALLQLAALQQGEGIIDLVNVYVQILLNDGVVGLGLLLGFLLIGTAAANTIRRRRRDGDPDMAMLGSSMIACVAGLLVTLSGGSLGNGTERMYYVLGALLASYVAMDKLESTSGARREVARQV